MGKQSLACRVALCDMPGALAAPTRPAVPDEPQERRSGNAPQPALLGGSPAARASSAATGS